MKITSGYLKKLIREELEGKGKKEAGEEKYSSLETDYGNVSDKVETLKRKLHRLTDPSKKKEMQSRIDALEDKMKSLDDEIESLSSQLSKYYK